MQNYLKQSKTDIDLFIAKLLPIEKKNEKQNTLFKAMHYCVLNPKSKRLRPALVFAVGEALGVPRTRLYAAAASIELIHCYSLVHDDLPAMDDDNLRRGEPTCHKKFDQATAILVGDALQALAFEILTDSELNPCNSDDRLEMIKFLAQAAGSNGMVLGQAKDLAAEKTALNYKSLIELHNLKTGAIFNACIKLALLAAKNYEHNQAQDQSQVKNLITYGKIIGLNFQIQDDLLDLEASTETLGKPSGSDLALDKATFPKLLGINKTKQKTLELHQQALSTITNFDHKADNLRKFSEFCIKRIY